MTDTLQALEKLSAAEEFFEYFSIQVDEAVVRVNRLHILKRFNQYLRANKPGVRELDAQAQFDTCRALLIRAYEDFVRSTPQREKVFKVFQDAEGSQVALDSLRSTLPSRNPRRP
jgi:nitrogenase-stabilizing/protective protein